MTGLYYLIFLAISYFLLKKLFDFSTYHRYFIWAGPLVAIFAVLQAYLLIELSLARAFVYHLGVSIVIFLYWGYVSAKQTKIMTSATEISTEDMKLIHQSTINTWLFFFLSVITYLVSFVVSFTYIYNTWYLPK